MVMKQKFRKIITYRLFQEYKVNRIGSKPKYYRNDFDERPVVAKNWNETTEQMMRQNFPVQNMK